MAAAIPAAIGVGGSIIGGIQGKGAAKKQQQLAQEQMRRLQPLVDAQTQGLNFLLQQGQKYYDPAAQMFQSIFGQSQDAYGKSQGAADTAFTDYRKLLDDALGKSNQLYGQGQGLVGKGTGILDSALPYLSMAGDSLGKLQEFYRPFMFDGQRAIDRFLPSAKRTMEAFAPEFGQVNQGYKSASQNINEFAPRGGGRISTQANMDVSRQRDLSNVFFQGRENLKNTALQNAFQAAAGEGGRAQGLGNLGQILGQLGLGSIGEGRGLIGSGISQLGTGGGLALNQFGQGLNALGLGLNALNTGQGAAGGLAGLATTGLGQGVQGGGNIYDMVNRQQDRAYGSQPQGTTGKGLGGYLVDFFSNKGVQDKIGGFFGGLFGNNKGGGTSNMFLTAPNNPFENQMKDFNFFA